MGRSTRWKLVGLLLGAAVFGQLACSGTTTSFDAHDSGGTATFSPGTEFDVTLGFIGGSTYGGPEVSSSAVAYEGSSVVPPYNPGGPTVQFRFQAVSAGAATITISTVVPIDAPNAPPAPFTLNVNVN
jgi:hypothetical protein